jgi:hypothetical protein
MSFYLSNSDTQPTGLEPLEYIDDPSLYAPDPFCLGAGPRPTGPSDRLATDACAIQGPPAALEASSSSTAVWAKLASILARRARPGAAGRR